MTAFDATVPEGCTQHATERRECCFDRVPTGLLVARCDSGRAYHLQRLFSGSFGLQLAPPQHQRQRRARDSECEPDGAQHASRVGPSEPYPEDEHADGDERKDDD
jgi:hypothetical protein